MKRPLLSLILLAAALTTTAQTACAQQPAKKQNFFTANNVFNHLDVAFTAGTSGLGFDLATPVTKWAQLRVGGVFEPHYRATASFGTEVAEGLSAEEQQSRFDKLSAAMYAFTGQQAKQTIDMEGSLNMNNFKMLVDIYPFQQCRKFHFTVGFYYGNGLIVDGSNTSESVRNLFAINLYNSMYRKALAKESLIDLEGLGVSNTGGADFSTVSEKLRNWGARVNGENEKGYNEGDVPSELNALWGIDPTDNKYHAEYGISVNMGKAKRDIIAQEDIYYDYSEVLDNPYYVEKDGELVQVTYRTDKNGRQIKKGEIKYKKGEVIRSAGETVRFVPDENDHVAVQAKVNKFKPFIGAGFTTPITKDGRTTLSVDAGVMFWGGRPSINVNTPVGADANGNTVYYTLDLVNDCYDLPTKVNRYVKLAKNFIAFPELSIRLAQRLW